MRTFLTGILVLLFSSAHAQIVLSGTVKDTASRHPLGNAVVSLLQKKDTVLYRFTRTDDKGRYQLDHITPGSYVLLITYPRFADFAETIDVQESKELGTAALTLKAHLLENVVIRSAGAIRIKGDTTEFVADSFHVREGATVEELLKKLPGFRVNGKGEVVAQGQRVQKVLVDGEEFFGDDPTAATRNITAKAVDKVQLFDTKSEQQNLTGISSGAEGKTLNIKLKEDQKRGAFGKAEAGSDFRNYTDARLLYNRFVGRQKLSLYGTKSTTSTGSLSWEDQRRLGIERDMEYDELSGIYYSFYDGGEFDNWNFRGLPDAYTAGAQFTDKWNEEKQGVNGSYRYNQLSSANRESNYERNLLPGNLFDIRSNKNTVAMNRQHAANGKWDWKIDSLSSLKLTVNALNKHSDGSSESGTETVNRNTGQYAVNSGIRTNDATRRQLESQLQYKQLFVKKGRQLLGTFRYGITDDDQLGLFRSTTSYYTTATPDSVQVQDQEKRRQGNTATYGGKLSFSEPLGNRFTVVAEYSHNRNDAVSHRNTFEKGSNGKYEVRNLDLSNNFDMTAFANTGSLYTRYQYKTWRWAAGMGLSEILLDLKDQDRLTTNRYRFVNLTPQASVNFTPKPQSRIGFNYRGTTRQPTIDQLQPLRNNENPLTEHIGNPELKVGFNHALSLSFSSYKTLAERGIWISSSYNFTEDAITQASTVSPSGKRVFQPVNVNGNRNWAVWAEWNKGEGEKKFNHTMGLEASGGRNISLVNGLRNQTDYSTVEFNYGIRYELSDKYSLYLNPKIGYNASRSSLNPTSENNYWIYGGDAEGFVLLPGKVELRTEVEFDLRQRINAFDGNPNVVLWNANLSRKFFKDGSGKLSLVAYDLLDRNRGFERTFTSERIQEETFQRVSQYFLLKFEWSFNKMNTKPQP